MKMMSRKLAMPLLGVLLWVISIHSGTFSAATLLPQPITGVGTSTKEGHNVFHLPHDLKITEKDLNQSVSIGHGIIDRMLRLETSLQWSNVHVQKGTPSHGQYIVSRPEEDALKQGREALVAVKATVHLLNRFCRKYGLSPTDCSKYLTSYNFKSTELGATCKQLQKLCGQEDILSPYRTIDGTCNHQYAGSQGSAFTVYKRLLHSHYLDGVNELRRSITKKALPSPRYVSASLATKHEKTDSRFTQAVPEWSQFVENDLSNTPSSKMVHSDNTIECCTPHGRHLSPRYIHPFCASISVPSDDNLYSGVGLDCMTYVRSVPGFRHDCTFGAMEQLNQATHYLDGSQIYGSTMKKAAVLRSFEKGQLKVTKRNNKAYLPLSANPSDDCQLDQDESVCFLSGDSRTNVVPQLTAMHTIWLREHNRVAKGLADLNPAWDDETLYQEARKIVVAEIQHITYDEWLPLVLGKKYFNKIEKYSDYDESVDPSVSNSFATAVSRTLNSLVGERLNLYQENRLVNSSIHLRNNFNNPRRIIQNPHYLDSLLRSLATQSSQKLDFRYPEDISSHLFSNGDFGFDVLSLDIQRGRDHGLPAYTSYRTLCGLPEVQTFDDLSDVMSPEVVQSLSKTYKSPFDVDLIVGGIAERPTDGSLFGPTFTCIFADQFLRTRRGDRYFYTNEYQPSPFSKAQIREIDKVSLARVFCDNGDDIVEMQGKVFEQISESNPLLTCDSGLIPEMNLRVWMDSRRKYY